LGFRRTACTLKGASGFESTSVCLMDRSPGVECIIFASYPVVIVMGSVCIITGDVDRPEETDRVGTTAIEVLTGDEGRVSQWFGFSYR